MAKISAMVRDFGIFLSSLKTFILTGAQHATMSGPAHSSHATVACFV